MDLDTGTREGMGEALVGLDHDARGHRPDRHHAVLDARAHARGAGQRHDLDRILAEVEANRVGVMDGDVRDHAAAGRGVVDPPALQVRRQVHGVKHPHAQHLPDPAVGDEVPDGQVRPRVPKVMVGREDDTLCLRRPYHLRRLGGGHRERLLAEHVLAGRDRCHGLGVVLLVGGRDVDGTDFRVAQHLMKVGGALRDRMPFGICDAALGVPADDGGDLKTLGPDRPDNVLRSDRARSDQPPFHRFPPAVAFGTFHTIAIRYWNEPMEEQNEEL